MKTGIRRAFSLVTALFIFVGSFCMFPVGMAASAAGEGYWKLVDKGQTDTVVHGNKNCNERYSDAVWSASEGTFTFKNTAKGGYSQSYGQPEDHRTCDGENVEQTLTISAPNTVYRAGETISLQISSTVTHNTKHGPFPGELLSTSLRYRDNRIKLRDDSGEYFHGYSEIENGGYSYNADGEVVYNCYDYTGMSTTISAEFPRGDTDGEELWLEESWGQITYWYKYEWVADKDPEVESGGSSEEGEGYWKQVDKGQTDTVVHGSNNYREEYSDAEWSVSEGTFTYKNTLKGGISQSYGQPENHRTCDGENVEQTLTISAPNTVYRAGETVSLHISSTVTHNTKHGPLPATALRTFLCSHGPVPGYPDSIILKDNSGEWEYGYSMIENGGYSYNADGEEVYNAWDYTGISTTISGEFPRGDTDGEELWLAESWGGGITYWYKYEWVANEDPEGESGSSSEEEEETAATTTETTTEPQYHWELVSREPRKEEYQLHAPAGTGKSHEEDGDRGFEWEWANNGTTFEYVYKCLYNHTNDYEAAFHDKEGCAGEFAIYQIAVDGLETEYAPGGTITLCLSVDAEKSEYLCPLMYSQLGTYLTGKNPDEEYPIRMDGRETTLVDKYGESWLYFIFDHADMENTRRESIVRAQFPEEAEVGDVVYLAIETQTYDIQLYSGYKFVYKEGAPVGAGTVKPDKGDSENWIVDTDAWKTPGEDDGISIPVKILIGVAGVGGTAAAAAGAAGAVGSSNGGETADDERRRKSSYKMYIYKDFGDSIRKGVPVVGVFARIAEITASGQEIDRSDLTAQIRLSSGTPGLSVKQVGIMNSYMGAEVCVPEEGIDLREGIVSASYTGAGGVFTENVHFRIIGRPFIQFPEKPENEMTFQKAMLIGDTTQQEILLNAEDFAEEPTAVTFRLLSDDINANSVIDVSSVRIERFRYKICLMSRIMPDPAHPSPYRISVWVKAANPKETAEDVFKLLVCPEGISVISPPLNDQKQLVINTEDADPGPGVKIKPIDLQLVCAYRDETGKVMWDTANFALGKLAPTDAVTTHVLAGFEYEVNTQYENEGRYYINPKTVLPVDPSKPYIVKLPVSYPRNAPRISTEIPVRLDGEPIDQTELFQREKEWELLKRDCQRYGLGAGGKAQQLMRQTKHGIASASDLRLIRRQILEEAREYYEQEATEMKELDEKLARCEMVFSVAKWLGDQAQSFLIKYTMSKIPGGSNYADLAELIIMPVKDAAVTAYGQCLANDYWGTGESASEVYKENFIKALTAFGDNAFMGTITAAVSGESGFLGRDYGESPLTKKQIAGLIVGYYTYLTIVHYTTGDEEKGDVWLSMWFGLKDLSFNSFKTYVCNKLGEFVTKSPGDDGVDSIYDKCVKTVFGWITVDTNGAGAFKKQLANVIGTYVNFFKGSDGLRVDAGQQAVDVFMDVFLNSTVSNIKAMFSGDKFIIKIGDAELQIFSTQWMLILVELLWEMIKTVFGTVVLKPLWDIIDYGKYLSGGYNDVKTVPYTPDEERREINSKYKSGGSENS